MYKPTDRSIERVKETKRREKKKHFTSLHNLMPIYDILESKANALQLSAE